MREASPDIQRCAPVRHAPSLTATLVRALVFAAAVCALACSGENGEDPGFEGKGNGSGDGGGASSGGGASRDWTSTPGAVIDKSSGLMWQRAVDTKKFTWDEAKAYCKALELADLDDWRLPHRDELCTIVDATTTAPSIDEKAFPNTPAKGFWTASKHAKPEHSYGIDFEDASNDCGQGIAPWSETHFVRCVR